MNSAKDTLQRLAQAYDTMLERVKSALETAGVDIAPALKKALDNAEEKATELGELSREEAAKIAEYLKRDIHDAAEYMADQGEELSSWARFDLELVEQRMLESFALVADKTTLALDALRESAKAAGWHTGEITSMGTLVCEQCGKALHFHKTSHIPPCPKCHHTAFKRVDVD